MIVATALLILIAAELIARYRLGLGTPALTVADPKIEYLFRPNQDVNRFGNRIIINEVGMRSGPMPTTERAPGEHRVLVFGDSVLNGGNLITQDDLATELLQRRLTDLAEAGATVGNISSSSWGPPNQLAYARQYGFFDANAVIIVMSSHDADDTPTFAPLNSIIHPQKKPWLALQEIFSRYAPPLIKKVVSKLSSDASSPVKAFERRDLNHYGVSALDELAELIQLSRPRPILVFHYPNRDETRSGVFHAVASDIKQAVTHSGATYIPLLGAAAPSLSFYHDQIHPNAAGQAWLADQIWPALHQALGYSDHIEQ